MRIVRRFLAGATLLVAASAFAPAAAQDVAWVTKINLPIGHNLPTGVSVDILGIAPGADPDAARAALAAYAPESMSTEAVLPDPSDFAAVDQYERRRMSGEDMGPPLREITTRIALGDIEISYLGGLVMKRKFGAKDRNEERIDIAFSAPSSGKQVLGIKRTLQYWNQEEQPRIGEMVAALSAKFGAQPVVVPMNGGVRLYRWQFDDGVQVNAASGQFDCPDYAGDNIAENEVDLLNRDGACDVVLEVQFSSGISDDHAEQIRFTLSDNERGKANLAADYEYFREYVTNYRANTGGATPTL